MAGDVLAGDKADDPLYLPMVARVRRMVDKSGLLYVGDSKMSALETRADIAVHKDYYLTPLPSWHITPLSSLQKQILAYLKLSPSLYKRLIENLS